MEGEVRAAKHARLTETNLPRFATSSILTVTCSSLPAAPATPPGGVTTTSPGGATATTGKAAAGADATAGGPAEPSWPHCC
eukprot:365105-Chlamydomonas_euryale.AAC.1